MKKLFERNQLIFALVWIGIYVAAFSAADSVSETLGIKSCLTAPLGLFISACILAFIGCNRLSKYYGLCEFHYPDFKKNLYFLPLVIIASANLWYGVTIKNSSLENGPDICEHAFRRVIEEIIFRDFCLKLSPEKELGLQSRFRASLSEWAIFSTCSTVRICGKRCCKYAMPSQ
jgi:hypothetical protein